MHTQTITIYTDGSAHPQSGIGSWAAFIFFHQNKTILKELLTDAESHNRMELIAIMKAVQFVEKQSWFSPQLKIHVYTDSQYACKLPERQKELKKKDFKNKKGLPLPNTDLIQKFLELHNKHNINLMKVKAHQKQQGDTKNWNREVDKLCRKVLREHLKKMK